MSRIKQEARKHYNPDWFGLLGKSDFDAYVKGALYEQSYQLEKSKKLVECLKRIETDLEKNINPLMESLALHPATLSLNDIKQALADFEGETNT